MITLYILLSVAIVLSLIYFAGRYNESYWKKRGVTFYTRNRLLGPIWDYMTLNRPMFEIIHDIYKKYPNEAVVGIGNFVTPTLYVKDIENVKHILQADFSAFSHRGINANPEDLLADNLLMMHGIRWKLMRQNLTPLFTSTKLKNMYYIMDKGAQDFVGYIKNNPDKWNGKAFDTLSTFCNAALSGAVFGISSKSTFDSPFLEMATKVLKPTLKTNLKFAVMNLMPSVLKILGLKVFAEYEGFFINAIKQVIRQREKENFKKHDFADMCVTLQKNGNMKDQESGFELEPTDELLAGQAFFFFLAGSEPSATALFSTFIELGRHPEMLSKVHEEIDATFDKYNDQLSYDAISEMEYLDKVLSEALRMHPPIGFLTRQCIRDSVLPVGNIKVQKGTRIFTPIYEYHHDPTYYPNPEVFDPERFSGEVLRSGDYSYQPFGKGGRICIGLRYARLQVKAGIVHFLRNFTVNTIIGKGGIKYSKQQVQVRPDNVDVEFIPRKIKST